MKKISFIVICFNGEKVITHCLRTILAISSDIPYEIIVVDDGSTDKTLEKVNILADSHMQLVVVGNQINKGRAHSRNVGLNTATGDYVCFVDADDFLFSVNLDEILPILANSPDIAVAGRIDFDIRARTFFSFGHAQHLYTGLKYIDRAVDFPKCFWDNFITGKFIKRSLLEKQHISFPIERKNGEDILFATLVWLHARGIYFSNMPLYVYGRGNYKNAFGPEKCEDVFVNIRYMIELRQGLNSKHERWILSSKYASTLYETIMRARGVIEDAKVVELLKNHYIPIANDFRLIYVNQKVKKFIDLCNSGNYAEAIAKA